MYRCESRPGTATPKDFLNQELSEHEDDKKFNYYQWETLWIEQYSQPLQPLTKKF